MCKIIKLGKNSNLVGSQRNPGIQIPYGLSFTAICPLNLAGVETVHLSKGFNTQRLYSLNPVVPLILSHVLFFFVWLVGFLQDIIGLLIDVLCI